MPKNITFESKNYLKTITFGPGLALAFNAKYKTYEENLAYRKKKGLDVYDPDGVLIGKYERHNRIWICYLYIVRDAETLNISSVNSFPMLFNDMKEMEAMDAINQFIKNQKLDTTIKFKSLVTEANRVYYSWYSTQKGFFIKDKIHDEIKRASHLVKQYYTNQTSVLNDTVIELN